MCKHKIAPSESPKSVSSSMNAARRPQGCDRPCRLRPSPKNSRNSVSNGSARPYVAHLAASQRYCRLAEPSMNRQLQNRYTLPDYKGSMRHRMPCLATHPQQPGTAGALRALLILFDSRQFAESDVAVPLICPIDTLIRQQQIEDHSFASVVGPDRTAPE
jgi:hypothetical protein